MTDRLLACSSMQLIELYGKFAKNLGGKDEEYAHVLLTHTGIWRNWLAHDFQSIQTIYNTMQKCNLQYYDAKMMSRLILRCYPRYGDKYYVPSNGFSLFLNVFWFYYIFWKVFYSIVQIWERTAIFYCQCGIARHHLHLIGIYLLSMFYIHSDKNPKTR